MTELVGWTEDMARTFKTWQDKRIVRPVDNECSWSWIPTDREDPEPEGRYSMWLLILPNGEVRGRFVEGPTILGYDVKTKTAYRSFQLDAYHVLTLVDAEHFSIQSFLPDGCDDEEFHIAVPAAANAWAADWLAANIQNVTPATHSEYATIADLLAVSRNVVPRGL